MTEVGARVRPSSPPGIGWTRSPWRAPPGRRPTVPRLLLSAVPVGLVASAWNAWPLLAGSPGEPLAWRIIPLVLSGIALVYGVALVSTSRRLRMPLRPVWQGAGTDSAAIALYGLAFIASIAVGYARGLIANPASAVPAEMMLWCAAPVVFCVFSGISVTLGQRGVKRLIVSGRAPSYVMSQDGQSWLDGDDWTSVYLAAPRDAVRSPDGNYWWTGRWWAALPSRPRRSGRLWRR
jgi:hypothetical protein